MVARVQAFFVDLCWGLSTGKWTAGMCGREPVFLTPSSLGSAELKGVFSAMGERGCQWRRWCHCLLMAFEEAEG